MKIRIFTMLICLGFFGIKAIAQPVNQTFATAGNHSYTVPVGFAANVTVQAWGGGGGGGSDTPGEKGGGGGGAYASSTFDLTQGTYPVTVGSGGIVGSSGGASTFNTNVVVAAGGASTLGTQGGAGGSVLNSTGTIKRSGGRGGHGGQFNVGNDGGGGGGGSATAISNGGNGQDGTSIGGDGGTGQGNGGKGGDGGFSPHAILGTVPGGGGGGKGDFSSSAAGSTGRVMVTVNLILPVELISFEGMVVGTSVELSWATASELNSEKFIVERSLDGRAFTAIGEVQSAGTVQAKQSYQFKDENPLHGSNYYRLKQMDFDGQFEISPVKAVVFENEKQVRLFPTATKGWLTVEMGTEEEVVISVYDLKGSMLKRQSNVSSQFGLDISDLPDGDYLIVIQTATGTYKEKILKI